MSHYVTAMLAELAAHDFVFEDRTLRTIYIGGGTPSLLPLSDFDRIFKQIDVLAPQWRRTVEEVCIEASPDSLDTPKGVGKLARLKDLGLTRVNLGVQSLAQGELRHAGRNRANVDRIYNAIDTIRAVDIVNLSTDLIIGFENQTDESWQTSVEDLVSLRPETISTYFLTIRPDAWFSCTGHYDYSRAGSLYDRYDVAHDAFLSAGFAQESNVRYKLADGGYRQKVLQFHGVPVLGVDLGARTYTNTVDYLRWTPLEPRHLALKRYMESSGKSLTVNFGFIYSPEERLRKRLALDLFELDVAETAAFVGVDRHMFEVDLTTLIERGMACLDGSVYRLTERGYKYRDIISWHFFSDNVKRLDDEYYAGLDRVGPRLIPLSVT
jgi:oxygen-independent coproporphyrinogen-3 oxidase